MADKKLFDVSHPGKSAPSATSKPVIVGHGPMLKDPMMQPQDKTEINQAKTTSPVTMTHEKVVAAPVVTQEKQDTEAAEPSKETAPPVEDDKKTDSEETAEPEASEADVINSVTEPVQQKKEQAEAEKKEQELQAHIAELIEKKTYAVPVNGARHRQTSHFLLVIVVLLAVATGAAAYAYQAGLLEL